MSVKIEKGLASRIFIRDMKKNPATENLFATFMILFLISLHQDQRWSVLKWIMLIYLSFWRLRIFLTLTHERFWILKAIPLYKDTLNLFSLADEVVGFSILFAG